MSYDSGTAEQIEHLLQRFVPPVTLLAALQLIPREQRTELSADYPYHSALCLGYRRGLGVP